MSISEAQARRALRHAEIPWDSEVDDPREDAWVLHNHLGLLGGMAAAFACGRRNLRRVEEFLADLGLGARRALGLGRGSPCDTTLYRLLEDQAPAGFEETVFTQVKDLIAAKVVKNDRLRLGVMTFDGKGTWSRADGPKVAGARQSTYDADGSSLQTFGALRAVLSSSSVCPCVGQKTIGSKEGEATAFRELLPKVCDELGGQFRIVTGDAGLCARENAALVTQLGRWYVFGLKGNQPHLYGLACQHRHYSVGKPLARTVEQYRGQTIERELYARDVTGDPEADIEGARQLWYVCQASYDQRGECVAADQRYFVTAIPAGTLTRDEELSLVRMHWSIENGCNWTMDVMLGEDDSQPCQASRASIETVSWLRIIGYNAVSAWRQQAPRKDRKPLPWARAMETLRDALLLAQVAHHEAIHAVT
jgi:predicted transposase YbfD/YdcC